MAGRWSVIRALAAGSMLGLAAVLLGCTASVGVRPSVTETAAADAPLPDMVREFRSEQTSITDSQTSNPTPPAAPSQRAGQQSEPGPSQPRPKVITLDPGHGGPEIGPVSVVRGIALAEKDSNLDFASRLRALLVDAGYHVVLTREGDTRATGEATGSTRFPALWADLQRRIEIANEAGSDLFLSIHSNGSASASEAGVEVWWEPNRPWGADNQRFAQFLQRHVVDSLAAWGYRAVERGLRDNTYWQFVRNRWFGITVLAPPRTYDRADVIFRSGTPEELGFEPGAETVTGRALNMPGALVEVLFMTNASDVAVLRDPGGRDAIARGMFAAIEEYFAAAR